MAAIPSSADAPLIVREGRLLIMRLPVPGQSVHLPPVCVRCGDPATNEPLKKNFYWHHPALYLILLAAALLGLFGLDALFLGLIIYVIVAGIQRKSVRVAVPLCAVHARQRGTWVTLAWVLPVVGAADAFVLPRFHVDPAVGVLTAVGLLLVGLIIWAVVGSPIRPRSIDDYRAEFSGFCEPFLEQYPIATPSQIGPY